MNKAEALERIEMAIVQKEALKKGIGRRAPLPGDRLDLEGWEKEVSDAFDAARKLEIRDDEIQQVMARGYEKASK